MDPYTVQLTAHEAEELKSIFISGFVKDGDVICKRNRDSLVEKKMIYRIDGGQALTIEGSAWAHCVFRGI